ncbi:YkvA family protein [Pseudomonas sp. Eth.TT006]
MTLWFCCRNPRTPSPVKVLCVLVVSYALSPIDLIPDFIPVLGLLDDVILLPAAIWLICRLIPEDVYRESREQARVFEQNNDRRPSSRVAAVVIIGVWVVLAVVFVRHFWG